MADSFYPLVVAGPSGVGKGTLLKFLRAMYPSSTFGYSVSYTSRLPRPGEVDGVHYHFVGSQTFLDMIQANAFLEWAEIYGDLYGTALEEVQRIQRRGLILLLEVDIQGVRQIKSSPMGHMCKYVFIKPPSYDELERRLRIRGTETEEKLQRRLQTAFAELQAVDSIGFDFILVNDDVNAAVQRLVLQTLQWYPFLKPLAAGRPNASN